MRYISGAAGVLFISACVGCADNRPSFAEVRPSYNEAVVYVYRNSTAYAGSGVDLKIRADDKVIGDVGNQGFVYARLSPGQHKIWSKTETTSAVPFTAVAGHSYYITAAVEWGFWAGRPNLIMVPEETGKLAIDEAVDEASRSGRGVVCEAEGVMAKLPELRPLYHYVGELVTQSRDVIIVSGRSGLFASVKQSLCWTPT